jgi:hypothetical protein
MALEMSTLDTLAFECEFDSTEVRVGDRRIVFTYNKPRRARRHALCLRDRIHVIFWTENDGETWTVERNMTTHPMVPHELYESVGLVGNDELAITYTKSVFVSILARIFNWLMNGKPLPEATQRMPSHS